jgi:hypothetical protein
MPKFGSPMRYRLAVIASLLAPAVVINLLPGVSYAKFGQFLFLPLLVYVYLSVPVFLGAALAWGLLGWVGVHLVGITKESLRTRENLPAAMVTGRKGSPKNKRCIRPPWDSRARRRSSVTCQGHAPSSLLAPSAQGRPRC